MAIPGTVVAAGLNSPRTSGGASGFRSQTSRCDGPPSLKIHRQGYALPHRAAGNKEGYRGRAAVSLADVHRSGRSVLAADVPVHRLENHRGLFALVMPEVLEQPGDAALDGAEFGAEARRLPPDLRPQRRDL